MSGPAHEGSAGRYCAQWYGGGGMSGAAGGGTGGAGGRRPGDLPGPGGGGRGRPGRPARPNGGRAGGGRGSGIRVNEVPVSPELLLDEADRLLREVVPGTRGLWPRACTCLIRMALEAALDGLWHRRGPRVAAAPMRAQLLVLTRYVDESEAARIEQLWATLSRCGHHHAYELAPTAAELRRWHDHARAAVALLAAAGGTR